MTTAFAVLRPDRPRLPQMLARFVLGSRLPLPPFWGEVARTYAEALETLEGAELQVKQLPPPVNLVALLDGIPKVRAKLPVLEAMLVNHMVVTPGVVFAAAAVALVVLR